MAQNHSKPRHPGRILEKEMNARGSTQQKLASILGISSSQLSEIFKGKRNITATLAVKLEYLWESPAEIWNNLQAQYNLQCARQVAQKESESPAKFSLEEASVIANYTPRKFLKDQGLLSGNAQQDRKVLLSLFGVGKIEDIKNLFSRESKEFAFFRSSQKLNKDKINGLTWEKLVRFNAKEKENRNIGQFDPDFREQLIGVLNELFWDHYLDQNTDVIGRTKEILSDFGILFIEQSKPPKCPIDGYAFMSGDKRAIAMTIRYKRLDNFAFTLMHELGHVFNDLKDSSSQLPIDDLGAEESERGEIEMKADAFARNALIPPTLWEDFLFRKKTDTSILHFARKHKIHPGILRGRLCAEKPSFYKRKTVINAMNKLSV